MALSIRLMKPPSVICDPSLDFQDTARQASQPKFSGRNDVNLSAHASWHSGRLRQVTWRSRGSLIPKKLSTSIKTGNYTFSSRRPCAVPSRRATGAEKEDLEGPEKEQGEEEVDSLMQGLTFGELCNEFECISSPAVERTARQLAKDIVELKEEKRQLSCYGMYCKYKDPLRKFSGREKFKRPSWILNALSRPKVALLKMTMGSTSQLTIRWRVRGNFLLPAAPQIGGPLTLTVTSTYELNQISGQVTDQTDTWEVMGSSPPAAAFFWTSRLAWTVAESGRDTKEAVEGMRRFFDEGTKGDGGNIYADPSDPRKFFQETNPNSEIYQIGLVLSLLYLLVTFLRQVL